MNALDTITAAVHLATGAESWIPAVFAGFIPMLGAAGVFWLLWRAIRSNPENDQAPDGTPSAAEATSGSGAPPDAVEEGGPESPPSS